MDCSNCGKKLDNDSLFCDNCGFRVENKKNRSTDNSFQPEEQQSNNSQEDERVPETVFLGDEEEESETTITVGEKEGNLPEKFGRYRVLKKINRGAMGIVYLARDDKIGRNIAIKVLLIDSSISDEDQKEVSDRFEREARAAGMLSNPNIVTIHDVGEEAGVPFIAMEYLGGSTLSEIIKNDPPSLSQAIDIITQILSALSYAHSQGVVHRDIKPDNIFLLPDGTVKVADFGIARIGKAPITMAGQVMGTPGYMSPEQVKGEAVGPASDLFSVGVMFYELLTGRKPFDSDSPTSIMYKIVHEEPDLPHLIKSNIPPRLEAVIIKAIAKRPSDRYGSALKMKEDIQALHMQSAAEPESSNDTIVKARPVDVKRDALGKFQKSNNINRATGGETILCGDRKSGNTPKRFSNTPEPAKPHDYDSERAKNGDPGERPEVESRGGRVVITPVHTAPEAEHKKKRKILYIFGTASVIAVICLTFFLLLFNENPGIKIPNVVAMSENDARAALSKAGLECTAKQKEDGGTEPGTVIAQSPGAAKEIKKGGKVLITVAVKGETDCPNVVGMGQDQALDTISQASLEFALYQTPTSDQAQHGIIISQEPPEGTVIEKGTSVTVHVGVYQPPVAEQPSSSTSNSSNSKTNTPSSTTSQDTATPAPEPEPVSNPTPPI